VSTKIDEKRGTYKTVYKIKKCKDGKTQSIGNSMNFYEYIEDAKIEP
jgi:hypothetical protein